MAPMPTPSVASGAPSSSFRAARSVPVGEVHVWIDEGYGGASRPKDRPPVPAHLDWDLWLGPSPERPYHKTYHPYGWHYFSDFGEGTVGNMGPHLQDLPFWALKLRHPLSVEAEGPAFNPESPPKWLIVRYEYGAREKLPPVKLTWYHGGKRPTYPEGFDAKGWNQGILFVGEKGQVAADYRKLLLLPQSKFADFTPPKPDFARVGAPRRVDPGLQNGCADVVPLRVRGPADRSRAPGARGLRRPAAN